MAEKLTISYDDAPYTPEQRALDLREHDSTYKLFLNLIKWSVISTVVVLVLLYIFLVA